ncbi:MAG: hypothetical protein AAF270_10490 [Pseudomonadota bacterium]
MRLSSAQTMQLLALALMPSVASAFTCAAEPYTLREAYEDADSIIIGVVTECAQPISGAPHTGGGAGCIFTGVEVLKGVVPARDYRGRADSAACGLAYEVGKQYLLFLDQDNQPLPYSAPMEGEHYRATQATDYARVLRDYRASRVDGLDEPWQLDQSSGVCTVSMMEKRYRISVTEMPTFEPAIEWTRESRGKQTIYTAMVPVLNSQPGSPTNEIRVSAFGVVPTFEDGAIAINVTLPDAQSKNLRVASVEINGKSWPLHRIEAELAVNNHTSVMIATYQIDGKQAQEIVSLLSQQPKQVTVLATLVEPDSAQAANDSDGLVRAPSANARQALTNDSGFGRDMGTLSVASQSAGSQDASKQRVFRWQWRSTQLPPALDAFRRCMETRAVVP